MTRRSQQPDPCIVVIFGASGDLTARKLFPALHNLKYEDRLPPNSAFVGSARTDWNDDTFRSAMRASVREHSRITPSKESWRRLADRVHYVPGDVADDEMFERLKKRLEEIDNACGIEGNRVWHLAMPPRFFPIIVEKLGKHGLTDTAGWQRIVIEKPFGEDLASARELNTTLRRSFGEHEIFRIDHYLGKETVQNLLVFRFSNAIFEPIWNRRYIDNVQITVSETLSVEARGPFYDQTGALKDVAQNHLLQLLALTAMEPPIAWEADAIRDEKVQVLRAVRRWKPSQCDAVVARGQYDGYREAKGVDPKSSTETFVALKLFVDDWRWAGVPFYLRTGKRMAAPAMEVVIEFQKVPHLLFKKTAVHELEPNLLVIRIQPNEGFTLTFGTKVPGPDVKIDTVDMDFDYETEFGSNTPEAYERLLLDCMFGEQTLFARSDEIEEAWEIVDPIMRYWSRGGRPARYKQESWGPASADDLLHRDGRAWHKPHR